MIFVTVGTDLPFDRMMRVVDRWVFETGRRDVFAQIGEGAWVPRHMPSAPFLEPGEFKRRFEEASVIIAHAGMGTILSALHHAKPILIMPKKASLGEQRNEHQIATARHMMGMGKVHVAFDEVELREKLDAIDALAPRGTIGSVASESLLQGLREFIHTMPRQHRRRPALLPSPGLRPSGARRG
jgi:UDP-N-acetylglucosamine transferase subunit ALG13